MDYQILPTGSIWHSGSFFVPVELSTKYIKLASEYQLKALIIIMSNNGKSSSKDIAKILGCTESDAEDFLEFWVEEGVLIKDGCVTAPVEYVATVGTATKSQEEDKPVAKKVEALPVPTLTPKEIVESCRDNKELSSLMNEAQEVLGKTLSHNEQELIVNMVNYYGLPVEIVITILHYFKSQRDKGRARGTMYIAKMAKNWSEEGIVTLDLADEKLKRIENSNHQWNEIVGMTGIRHSNPTDKQRSMIEWWFDNFSLEMISIACDIMKENTEKVSLGYVNKVLKNWYKKGISTPENVRSDQEKHKKANESGHDDIDSTYDINEIARKAMFDDNYDI